MPQTMCASLANCSITTCNKVLKLKNEDVTQGFGKTPIIDL